MFALVRDEDGKLTMEELREARKLIKISNLILDPQINTIHRWWQVWEKSQFLKKNSGHLQRSSFLAKLVALYFTPVSEWVGRSFKLA